MTDEAARARVDRWLWAVRLCPTRSAATALCRAGHVTVSGRAAKASTTVTTGDRVQARIHGLDRDVEVVTPIERRVGAALAVGCYLDHAPPAPPGDRPPAVAERDRGTGRPTKRDRRRTDQLRG